MKNLTQRPPAAIHEPGDSAGTPEPENAATRQPEASIARPVILTTYRRQLQSALAQGYVEIDVGGCFKPLDLWLRQSSDLDPCPLDEPVRNPPFAKPGFVAIGRELWPARRNEK